MKITVMPMSGKVQRHERLHSLSGCHAITERQVVKHDQPKLGPPIEAAIKELLLADRLAAIGGKVTFIIEVEL
jgi:hypothetical protein